MIRSRFAVGSLCLMFSCLAASAAQADTPPSTFGNISFVVPAGWLPLKPDAAKTLAALALNGTTWADADSLIKIDAGQGKFTSAKDMANDIAGADGKVSADPIKVDGEDGYKVETTSTDISRPHIWLIMLHRGDTYLVMAAEKQGKDASAAMSAAIDEIARTWKWLPTK